MTNPSQPSGLTHDDVYLIGLARGESMVSHVYYHFGPCLEILAIPKTKETASHIRRTKKSSFVFNHSANPFTKNTIDYFIEKNSKSVLQPGKQAWMYASWKDGHALKQAWIRELISYQEDSASLRDHSSPKQILYGLEIDGKKTSDKKKDSYDLCRDPANSDFLKTFSLGYTHLPSHYAVRDFDVWLEHGCISWMGFSPSHPFDFYKIEIDDGTPTFLRNKDGSGYNKEAFFDEDNVPEYQLFSNMRKVSEYLDNIPVLCDHLDVPDFSSYLSLKPKITADLSAHIHLDALVFDNDVSKKQTAFFKEKFMVR